MLTSIVDATATRIDDLVEKSHDKILVTGLGKQLLEAKRNLKDIKVGI